MTRLKTAAALLLLAALVCSGLGLLTHQALAQPGAAERAGGTDGRPSLATSRGDLGALQGVWRVATVAAGAQITVSKDAVFLVRGNRACWQTPDDPPVEGGLYLDPTSSPRAYDFATSARTQEGIYLLDGDTLLLCYDLALEARRPRQFAIAPHGRRVLLVLKRDTRLDIRDHRRPDGTLAFPDLVARAPRPVQAPPKLAATPPSPVMPPRPAARIGQVIIIGNDRTPDAAIRQHLTLFPGQVLDYPSLRDAEKSLEKSGLFVVDPHKGIRPTVTVLDPEDPTVPFKDILVQVREAPPDPEARKALLKEVNELRDVLRRLDQELAEVRDGARRPALKQQADALRDQLKRLESHLPTGPVPTNQGPPRGVSINSDTGLTGSIVLNERNFDLDRVQATQAEKDFRVAEFYRRTGQPASAIFYYELVCRRYPNSPHAERARAALADLKRPTKD